MEPTLKELLVIVRDLFGLSAEDCEKAAMVLTTPLERASYEDLSDTARNATTRMLQAMAVSD